MSDSPRLPMIHLVSAPWSDIRLPSVQTATLKSYLDAKFGKRIQTRTYAAHLEIMHAHSGCFAIDFMDSSRDLGDYAFYCALYDIAPHLSAEGKERDPHRFLTRPLLKRLREVAVEWTRQTLLPALSSETPNLVGFTLNYQQTYSSLLIAKTLLELAPEKTQIEFVFGGYCAGLPEVQGLLKNSLPGAFFILAEGEQKLSWLIENFQAATQPGAALPEDVVYLNPESEPPSLTRAVSPATSGFAQTDLTELPLPDFDEYFDSLREVCRKDPVFEKRFLLQKGPVLLLEGSRGCFAKCDFCAENAQWRGFRKLGAKDVFDRAVTLSRKYQTRNLRFLDNVCDTWAEEFAKLCIENGEIFYSFMEMRAHHPEEFWIKLRQSGAMFIQVGIETLSPHLLKEMRKGVSLIQNVAVLKYLTELNIISLSNLIIRHPKSNLEDVRKTAALMRLIPHFTKMAMTSFAFFRGSPIFEELPEKARAQASMRFPRLLTRTRANRDFITYSYAIPESMQPSRQLGKEWDEFGYWLRKKLYLRAHRLDVVSAEEQKVVVRDQRLGRKKQLVFKGVEAQVFNRTHQITTHKKIATELQVSELEVIKVLQKLIARELLFEDQGQVINLCIREESTLTGRPRLTHEGQWI